MDDDAIRGQLEPHHAASYGWALHCCGGDPEWAADTLQVAYLKVLDGRARYDGRSAFKTWLFAVVRTTAADERRHRWRRALRLAWYQREHGSAVAAPTRGQRLDRAEL